MVSFRSLLTYFRRLDDLPPDQANERISRVDLEGNDLLVATTIKSLNADAVKAVLELNKNSVNSMIPVKPHYYSAGKRPLHIAVHTGRFQTDRFLSF